MSDPVLLAVAGVLAYLVGSVPFGVLIGRLRGVDVREKGSGNIGATNVARTVGKKLGLVVLLLDAAKGALPLAIETYLGWPGTSASVVATPIVLGVAPILGHCFSPWLRFRGGKGVATSLGVIAASNLAIAGVSIGVFATVYALSRVASISSLTTAMAVPVLFYLWGADAVFVWLMVLATVVIVIQHRGNIRRIAAKTELKV